jgi:hypothetical protein
VKTPESFKTFAPLFVYSYTITGLEPCAQYIFTVKAANVDNMFSLQATIIASASCQSEMFFRGVVRLVTYSRSKISCIVLPEIFACLLDLNFKQSKLGRLNF